MKHTSTQIRAIATLTAAILTASAASTAMTVTAYADDNANITFSNSDFIELEQPELDDETKELIKIYKKDPTMENYLALRDKVIVNYDAVLVRKNAKLDELTAECDGKPGVLAKIAEMEDIVQEMYISYWNRINSSMLRFTDNRLNKWKISDAAKYEYIPVMGAGESIYVTRTPVTNAQYAEFVKATGASVPENWSKRTYPEGEADYPVTYVSLNDAEAYCEWLTEKDGVNTYRLPNESEWELAAGHMPKDAYFNCQVVDHPVSVYEYEDKTRGAHGAIDFWGNVWEWTTTTRADGTFGVKGGSFRSARTDCRTEYREEGREAVGTYDDVGFRVIQVLNGEEPEQKVELATLAKPAVTATAVSDNKVRLSWNAVEDAVMYQLFTYDAEANHLEMGDVVTETTAIYEIENAADYRYIVQPISYVEICDNVSGENSVSVTVSAEVPISEEPTSTVVVPSYTFDSERSRLTLTWDAVEGVSTYYVYKYNTEKARLSTPKVVNNKTEYTYYKAQAGSTYVYLVSTQPVEERRNYDGEGCVTISLALLNLLRD